MDIFMPKMNGLEATKAIMHQCPTPILIISSPAYTNESKFAFDALQAGALSIIDKPTGTIEGDFSEIRRRIIDSIRALANVHVFRRPKSIPPQEPQVSHFISNQSSAKILALGASTGGPEALRCILSSLPANFPMPIVITQHITEGFLLGLIHWLQKSTQLKLEIAQNQQKLQPGFVYFAADNTHLIIKKGVVPIAILDDSPKIDHFRPSINALFSSVAKSYPGAAIGGILTGMGRDGAEGLLQMKEAKCVTFAQSEGTSIIFGMPSVALGLTAAQYSVDLEKISQFLAKLVEGG
jgi:two-component system chemotaxis response regulator CheB